MVVTSPPYFGLRTYHGSQNVEWSDGSTCPFGNEKSVQEYVNHSIEDLVSSSGNKNLSSRMNGPCLRLRATTAIENSLLVVDSS